MVCSKCGAEIPEGMMYCPKCGNAIQIVPDFEPDLEDNLAKTSDFIAGSIENIDGSNDIGGTTREISGDTKDLGKVTEKTTDNVSAAGRGRKYSGRKFTVICISALVLCVCGILLFYFAAYSDSYSSHMKRAASYMADKKYEMAVTEYRAALVKSSPGRVVSESGGSKNDTGSESSEGINARLGLAQALYANGKDDEAEECLKEVISEDPANYDAYDQLINIYKAKDDYTSINRLIAMSSDDSVFEKYSEYLALPPEFSEEPGTYDEMFILKLEPGDKSETIFYTTDGSSPTSGSARYTSGIVLKEGINNISAVCMNKKGFISTVLSGEFSIEIPVPDAPEIVPQSGSYTLPENISITVSGDDRAYYTTDGTEPDETSLPYTGELPMPFGKSEFSFVIISANGKKSDISTAEYDLTYTGSCQPSEAVNYLMVTLVSDGSLSDLQGHVAGSSGQYSYVCSSCTRAGSRVYYMMDEMYADAGGSPEYTGTIYALDTVSLELYKAKRNSDGNFVFEMFY